MIHRNYRRTWYIKDVNNLYGCQPLPYAEFRWIEDTVNFDVGAIALNSLIGYILEIDLEYP